LAPPLLVVALTHGLDIKRNSAKFAVASNLASTPVRGSEWG
jgi:hypothetical protein